MVFHSISRSSANAESPWMQREVTESTLLPGAGTVGLHCIPTYLSHKGRLITPGR